MSKIKYQLTRLSDYGSLAHAKFTRNNSINKSTWFSLICLIMFDLRLSNTPSLPPSRPHMQIKLVRNHELQLTRNLENTTSKKP